MVVHLIIVRQIRQIYMLLNGRQMWNYWYKLPTALSPLLLGQLLPCIDKHSFPHTFRIHHVSPQSHMDDKIFVKMTHTHTYRGATCTCINQVRCVW
jgi:hypothetical protein